MYVRAVKYCTATRTQWHSVKSEKNRIVITPSLKDVKIGFSEICYRFSAGLHKSWAPDQPGDYILYSHA